MHPDPGSLASENSDQMIRFNLFRFLSGKKVQFHLSRKNHRKFHSNGKHSRRRFASSYTIDTSRPVARHILLEEESSNHSTKCRGDRSTYVQETRRKYAGHRYRNIGAFNRLRVFVHSPMSTKFSAFRNNFSSQLWNGFFAVTWTFPFLNKLSSQWLARCVKLSQFCFERNINRSMQHRLELLNRVRTGPEKSWILLSHFPGLGSLGTRLLVLESSGNMLNSRQKYEMCDRQWEE